MVSISERVIESALIVLKIRIVFLLPMGMIIPPRVQPRASPS
jgi:hypothetical protein